MDSSRMYAEIIIPFPLPKNYTWAIPERLREQARPGVRVEVVFGKQRKYAGIIKRLTNEKPEGVEPKDILDVLDDQPIVFPVQLKFWEWIAHYYLCSEGDAMAAALPAAFKLSSETVLLWNETYGEDFSDLDHDEYIVAEALQIKKELNLNEVQQLLDVTQVYPIVKRLLEKKVCFVREDLKESYSPRMQSYVRLHPEYEKEEKLEEALNNWGRAQKQMELLLAFLHLKKTSGEVEKSELLKKSGATDAQLKGLLEKEILIVEKRAVDRLPLMDPKVELDFTLSEAQQNALLEIKKSSVTKAVTLLHGVTGSGKTQVYIHLIEEALRHGKQVLYLLPEIALTSQIIRRLQHHFGGNIGVYHSKFNPNERVEIWNKVKNGELKILLGARSALFLPFRDLGLVIIDEEHDSSYKQQDPAPRYHARDAAILFASLFGARVVLGSATPSIESYHHALNGKYGLVELNERYGGIRLPEIVIVDLRSQKPEKGQKVIISIPLRAAIEETLRESKQVILFQNRRGYTPYQVCQTCGWIPHCKHCDVTLTYHKQTNKLHCHYCGSTYALVHTCAACGSSKFKQQNFGTERIEEELQEIFPDAKIARMDVDTVRGKTAHEQLIRQFEQHRIDILVGTQMVVKGLDFENVQLVGILDADGLLNFADFRVNERGFQLMEQVSGRAGRKDELGRVLVQAYQVTHPVLHFVQQHDYKQLYHFEITGRKQFHYPPFSRVLLLTFKHRKKEVVEAASGWFAERIRKTVSDFMVGPAEPVVNRIRNMYLMELLLKLPPNKELLDVTRRIIRESIQQMNLQEDFKRVLVVADMDHV